MKSFVWKYVTAGVKRAGPDTLPAVHGPGLEPAVLLLAPERGSCPCRRIPWHPPCDDLCCAQRDPPPGAETWLKALIFLLYSGYMHVEEFNRRRRRTQESTWHSCQLFEFPWALCSILGERSPQAFLTITCPQSLFQHSSVPLRDTPMEGYLRRGWQVRKTTSGRQAVD